VNTEEHTSTREGGALYARAYSVGDHVFTCSPTATSRNWFGECPECGGMAEFRAVAGGLPVVACISAHGSPAPQRRKVER
jgi:hypothetical protein